MGLSHNSPSSSLSCSHRFSFEVFPQNSWMKTLLASHQNFQWLAIDWFFFYVVIWLSVVSKFQESILISWVNTCFWYDWWSKYTLTFLTTQGMRYEGMLMSICTYKFLCVTTIALSFFLKKRITFLMYSAQDVGSIC